MLQLRTAALILASILFASHAFATGSLTLEKSDWVGFPHTLGDRDFFVYRTPSPTQGREKSELTDRDCRSNIKRVICLVEPVKEGESPGDRKCQPGGEAYAAVLEQIHDQYPPALRKVFCSLRYIFIEKDFAGTAYAGTIEDSNGKTDGALMGIRKSVIDENLDLTIWASWKEQLSFGGPTDKYSPRADLPSVRTETAHEVNDFLYFVIAHEFGHILDFANQVNATENCQPAKTKDEREECELKAGTWGSISWKTTHQPIHDFRLRKGLCFYWCKDQPLPREAVQEAYLDLWNSDFLSIYATTQPWDDFADSLAYYVIDRDLQARYMIDTKQGATYDIIHKLRSDAFRVKYEYLDTFLKRSDLVYP